MIETDTESLASHSLDSITSFEVNVQEHAATRKRNARSESLVGSYLTRQHPTRFTSFSNNHGVESSTTTMDASTASILRSAMINILTADDEGTSWWAGVIIMANCTIGMGLLNFPKAIVNAGGVVNALAFEMVILVLIILSLYMVGRCSRYYGNVSYQDMVTTNVGKFAGTVCRVCIFLNNFGACIIVLVVLGDQWERLMYIIFDKEFCHWWYASRKLFVPLFSFVGILPLCLLKSFDVFKYTSFLGVLAAGYVAFGIGLTRAITGIENFTPGKVYITSQLTTKVVKIVPLICFAYECHIEAPPMMACLKKSSTKYYMQMVVGYVMLSFIVYSVGGISGYATFGNRVHGDFILGYARDDKLILAAMLLLSLKIWSTYPVIFYCLRTVVDDVWRKTISSPQILTSYWPRRLIQTLTLVTSTVLISVFVPSISDAIDLIGGISSVFVFVFPGLCYMRMHMQMSETYHMSSGFYLGCLYVIIGVFLMGTTTSLAIQEYLTGSESEPKICC